jgi:hypothetical protein
MEARRSLPFPLRAAAGAFVLAFFPAICEAEKFVYLGSQPDGVEVHVQVSPPVTLADGKRQGWFRTILKKPLPINDENGETRQYIEMLAYNVADCTKRTMGASAMIYYDDKNAVVARFEVPPKELVLRKIKANTLGDSMLGWLCTTQKHSPPIVKSPGTESPFK